MKEKTYVFESSGLPFDSKTKQNIDGLRARVAGGMASLIIIDGTMGKGKTTLAVEIADDIQGSPISFDDQLAMGGKQFIKKADIVAEKGLKVLIYDEAGDFNRRGSLQKFNAMLNRFFDTYRAFKIIVIVVLPNFRVLDKQLLDNCVPRLLIHITKRTSNIGYYNGYCLRFMYDILKMMKKEYGHPALAYKYVRPNFTGYFKNLPPARCKELDAFSTAGKKEILQLNRANIQDLVNRQDIANHFGRTPGWVSIQLAKYNIKPVEKIGKLEYYTKEILKTIERNRIIEGNNISVYKKKRGKRAKPLSELIEDIDKT